MARTFVIALAIVVVPRAAFAQTAEAAAAPAGLYDDLAKDTDAQLTAHQLPQIPATFALGLETAEVQRPGTMSDLGATLVNSFNDNSTLKTGVAIEVAPFRLWRTNQFTAEQWARGDVDRGWQILDGIALSAATAGGRSDTAGVARPPLSSVGLRLDLLNTADPRRSKTHYGCVRTALSAVARAIHGGARPVIEEDPVPVAEPDQIRHVAQQQIAACDALRDGYIIELAGALVVSGEPAMTSSTFRGGRAWLSLGAAVGALDLTLEGDYRDRRDDRTRHDWFVGGRIEDTASDSARLSFGLEAYFAELNANVSAERSRRIGLGLTADVKLASGLVLSVGAQGRTDFSSDLALVVLTKISFVLDGKRTDLLTSYRQLSP